MLAGKMKLKHFLLLVAALGAAGVAGAYFACRGDERGDDQVARAVETPPPRQPPPVHVDPPPTVDEPPVPDLQGRPGGDGLRDVDRFVLGYRGKDLGSKKIKDASKGRPYKVNLYQDDGHTAVNRAKIDLDRDDRWDEKITFDGDEVSRKVAPNDDEDYTSSFDWNGEAWVPR